MTVDHSHASQLERTYSIPFEQTLAEYEPRMVINAEGPWLEFADGKRLLDFHGQYMCVGVGHSHPKLRSALHQALDDLDYVCEVLSHRYKGHAAKLLCEDTIEQPSWAGAAKFTNSGSEAVELALLLARLVTNRPVVVTTQGAYHGWTSGASAVTTLPYRRNGFHDLTTGEFRAVPTWHPEPYAAPGPISCLFGEPVASVVERTEAFIRAVGVDNVAAIITEIYHGAGGYFVPDGYPEMIREMCDRLGILWIDDEIIAGAGRTGRWWAYQHFGVTPDLMCTAKGLTSSAVPAGAVVMSDEIASYLRRGRWATVSTFGGHPLACAAIAANIEIMLEERVVEHVAEMGVFLGGELESLVSRHPSAMTVTGKGLAWAIELCRDPATGERWVPADRWLTPSIDEEPSFFPGRLVADVCEQHGVLLFNVLPNTVTIAPPLAIKREELRLGLEALEQAFLTLDKHVTSPA